MSRRRDWSPTGVLVPSSRVKLYRRIVPADSKPEKVIVRIAGQNGERKEPFPTKTAAKAYYTKLDRGIGLGEDFDVGSFAPVSWGQPSAPDPVDQPMTWLTWVCQHIDDKGRPTRRGRVAYALRDRPGDRQLVEKQEDTLAGLVAQVQEKAQGIKHAPGAATVTTAQILLVTVEGLLMQLVLS